MKNPVLIKGNKYGISLALSSDIEFVDLLEYIGQKFKESARFFDTKQQIAISFEGRTLSNEEIQEILQVIKENCDLEIAYIIDNSTETMEQFQTAIAICLQEQQQREQMQEEVEAVEETNHQVQEITNSFMRNCDDGRFYKGTLRSGQAIHSDPSIIVVGDVNPGASIIPKGNIIVLGSIKGTAHAGCNGSTKSFVAALDMNPMQIRIGNVIARSPDANRTKKGLFRREPDAEAKIAYVEGENIYIEPISKTVLSEVI